MTHRPVEARPGLFVALQDPEHTIYRHRVNKYFTMRQARRLQLRITATANSILSPLESRVEGCFDAFSEVAWPFPGIVISDVLGLTVAERDQLDWAIAQFDNPMVDRQARSEISESVWSRALLFVERKKHEPGDDLPSWLLKDAAVGEGTLTDDELVSAILSVRLGAQAPVAH